MIIEEYDHPRLPVTLLAVTLYDRRDQVERCDFVGLDGLSVSSADAGCAANQEWRRARVEGAALRIPDEMFETRMIERTRTFRPPVESYIPDPSPGIGIVAPASPRSCITVKINFGLDQKARNQTFEGDDSLATINALAAKVAPLVDETNGQQLMYLAAARTAAGLIELKERIVDELQKP